MPLTKHADERICVSGSAWQIATANDFPETISLESPERVLRVIALPGGTVTDDQAPKWTFDVAEFGQARLARPRPGQSQEKE
jgi:hypothetical protein